LLDTQGVGNFNASAPNPVRNHKFASAAGQALKRPTVFPVPRVVLKMLLEERGQVIIEVSGRDASTCSNVGGDQCYRTVLM
jgi:NAD dependent epimerase/dehydratase family enzyme